MKPALQRLVLCHIVVLLLSTLPVPDFVDGLTHWSLTGSTMTDEDTFMGFSDGLSQSGMQHTRLCCDLRTTPKCNLCCLLDPSGVCRGGDDGLRSADLHPAGRRGLGPACGQVALPAEEFLGWLLFHTGRRGSLPPGFVT